MKKCSAAKLLTQNIWDRITSIAKRNATGADVAVAYFGSGASRLLPLKEGSRLVVDMSLAAVASGQTNPAELLALIQNGVEVYSVTNLHAKVFAFRGRAFVGSANASQHSARGLIEAVVETTDPRLVAAARRFVRDHCLRPVTAEYARQMKRYYKPPKFGGRKQGSKRPVPAVPPLRVVRLRPVEFTEREDKLNESGRESAQRKRKHPRSSKVDYFRWAGRCPFKKHELVLQITAERPGRVWVSPPGNVIDIKPYRVGGKQRAFVYVEVRKNSRRRKFGAMVRRLGAPAKHRLARGGVLRDPDFVRRLLRFWSLEL